jgi:hypothetical protein
VERGEAVDIMKIDHDQPEFSAKVLETIPIDIYQSMNAKSKYTYSGKAINNARKALSKQIGRWVSEQLRGRTTSKQGQRETVFN